MIAARFCGLSGRRELHFTDVMTEVPGDFVTPEQISRMCNRYHWAASYCIGKDVLEAACGAGQGLRYLAAHAKSLVAGDLSTDFLALARVHYDGGIDLGQFDAQNLPFRSQSLDVVILFEALYFLPHPEQFVAECARVLRPDGKVLIATANKDIYEFIPAPMSHRYFGVPELEELFGQRGLSVECFGDTPVSERRNATTQMLRHLQHLAVRFGLMPKHKRWKMLIKRVVYGRVGTRMPSEIDGRTAAVRPPTRLEPGRRNDRFKILYCVAALPGETTATIRS